MAAGPLTTAVNRSPKVIRPNRNSPKSGNPQRMVTLTPLRGEERALFHILAIILIVMRRGNVHAGLERTCDCSAVLPHYRAH